MLTCSCALLESIDPPSVLHPSCGTHHQSRALVIDHRMPHKNTPPVPPPWLSLSQSVTLQAHAVCCVQELAGPPPAGGGGPALPTPALAVVITLAVLLVCAVLCYAAQKWKRSHSAGRSDGVPEVRLPDARARSRRAAMVPDGWWCLCQTQKMGGFLGVLWGNGGGAWRALPVAVLALSAAVLAASHVAGRCQSVLRA